MRLCILVLAVLMSGAAVSARASFPFSFGDGVSVPDSFYSSPERKVVFTLYTRQSPATPVTLLSTDDVSKISSSGFNPSNPTKLMVHGFMSHMAPGTAGFSMRDAILGAEDCNLILVDWSAIDNMRHMTFPDKVVPIVGNQLAKFMNNLIGAGADVNSLHILAHSLGAHIAGYAGSKVLGPAKAGKITALDPVGQSFEKKRLDLSLDPSDAGFVVAIHTDSGLIGMSRTVGHVDFFPDGGHHPHRGCSSDLTGVCSHCFVYEIVLHAIANPGAVVGTKCPSWSHFQEGSCSSGETAVVGLNTDSSASGSFYFASTSKPTKMQTLLGRDIGGFAMDLLSTFLFGKRDVMAFIHC